MVEQDSPALATFLDDSFSETHRLRRDGRNGEKMTRFCKALGETGVVTAAWRDCPHVLVTANIVNIRA